MELLRLIDPLLPAACSRGSINRGRGNAMNKQEHNVHNDTKDLPMESHIAICGQVVEIGDLECYGGQETTERGNNHATAQTTCSRRKSCAR